MNIRHEPITMTKRTLLASGGALLAAPLFGAVPAKITPGLKAVVLVARKEGMALDAFMRHWLDIHAAMAAVVPGVKGFVGSEPVGPPAMAEVPFHECDGIASIWYPSREEIPAILSSAEGKKWLADGDLFISRPLSRNYGMHEHMIVPDKRVSGCLKRTVLMVRRPGLSSQEFLARWLGRNAELALKVPEMAGCVYSEVLNASGPAPTMDGMLETWWNNEGPADGGRAKSPQARAWQRDYEELMDRANSRVIISKEHVAVAPPLGS